MFYFLSAVTADISNYTITIIFDFKFFCNFSNHAVKRNDFIVIGVFRLGSMGRIALKAPRAEALL